MMNNKKAEKKAGKKTSLAAKILLWIIIAATVLVIAASFVAKYTGSPVFVFGKSVVWVMTESMEDEIPAQSYILVEKTSGDSVAVGDVITFYSSDPTIEGSLNTHRIIGVNEDGSFITKGDNNITEDNYSVAAGDVVAKYIRVLPVMSKIGQWFSTTTGLIIVIVAVILITGAFCVPDFIKASREKKEAEQEEQKEKIDELVRKEVEKLEAEGKKSEGCNPNDGSAE